MKQSRLGTQVPVSRSSQFAQMLVAMDACRPGGQMGVRVVSHLDAPEMTR